MSSLSRCTVVTRAPKALPAATLLKVMLVFAVLLACGLSHLCLRFSLNKLRSETIGYQTLQSSLQSETNALRSQTEALMNTDRLTKYAELELGMVRYRASNRDTLAMPRDISQRYMVARAALERPVINDGEQVVAARAQWLEKLGERLGLIGQAVAHETQ